MKNRTLTLKNDSVFRKLLNSQSFYLLFGFGVMLTDTLL